MTTHPDPQPGLLLAGRYHLRGVLGRGGAGSVWLADDEVLDRPVAVKLLHPELERDTSAVVRFRREATAAGALTHPNAVIVYDIGEDEDRVFLVMEFVDGLTLSTLLADCRLAPDDVATIGLSVARALGAAHRRDLVHRDVKPGNVLINREGVAKVADFGIATALGDAQARLTSPGMVVGSSAYLAPEQLEGGTIDARADVYSLGLVLHECLTGRTTFSGGTAAEVAARRLTSDPPPPSELAGDVPEELDLAVQRATRRDPSARFADGEALADALAPLVPADATGRLARLVASHRGAPHPPAPDSQRLEDPTAPAAVPARARERIEAGAGDAATTALPRTPAHAAPAGAAPATRTSTLPATDRPAEPAPPPGRGRWRGPWPWLVALVALGLIAVAVLDLVQGDRGPEGSGDESEPTELAVDTGGDFDPFGSGEHPEDVPNAYDGDPETAWQTQRYNSAALGGLKPGTGMWVDLGETATIRRLDLAMRPAGADLEVYAATDPLPDPGGLERGWSPEQWGEPVAQAAGTQATESLELEAVEGRYVLLWFTSLPPDGGGHRVHVSEVTLAG